MANTGKYLEAITSSIEKCSIDNVEKTLIKRNVKLVDRDNVEREVDIYVETIANRKKLKYVIECKEFKGKTKVEIKHVTDFYDKISNQGIKGIIITTSDFTSGAVKKAKNLNIDIYKIIDNPDPVIKNYQIIQKRHHVNNAQVFSTHFTKFNKPDLQYIYLGSNKKRYSFEEFIKDYLIGGIEKYIRQNQEELFSKFIEQNEKGPKLTINKKEPTSFSDSFESVYFKQDNEFYPIEKYQVNVDFWIDYHEEDNPTSFQYFDITNNKLIANFFSKSIEIEAGIKGHLNLIELTETEEIKMDYVTENPSHQKNVKTYDFGTFQPGELKFEINKLEKK